MTSTQVRPHMVPAPRTPMQFLTVQEVAAHLRVSKMTVYRLCESRAIESTRVGRSIRIHAPSVRDYVHRQES